MSPSRTFTLSIEILLRVLAAVIGVLLGLLAGAAATAMSRHDGDTWPTAIRHGGKTFAGTIAVLVVLYGLVVVTA